MFNNLHDVGQDLADLLIDSTGIVDTLVGPPLDPPNAVTESIRITLLWLTPQPTHRNDLPEANDDGTRRRPPVSLSAYYLISTYGTQPDTDPVQAHNLLGLVLQTFHSETVVTLPGPVATLGEGRLAVIHQPTTAELMEKCFNPLQIVHRPWALFEVAPVQLRHLADQLPPEAVVHPGGIRLGPIEVTTPPVLERVTPNPVRPGGLVRLDTDSGIAPTHVTVGGVRVPAAALSIPVAGGPVFLDLGAPPANAVGTGAHDVSLTAGGINSEPVPLTLSAPPVPSVHAPTPGFHSIAGGDLVLAGQDLGAALEAIVWPDGGVAAPSEVVTLALAGPPLPNQVTVAQADLAAAGLRFTTYRLTVRVGPHLFTPWVLLEVRP